MVGLKRYAEVSVQRLATTGFIPSARFACMKTTENVKFGRSLPKKYHDRYMEVYYRDIAMFPIKTALKLTKNYY